MSKENLARAMEQMQLDPSLQQKQVVAPNAAMLNSPKSSELEDRKIKSSPYSLGKLIEWKRLEDTMKSIARRTLALFGCALVIGTAMPAAAGEPRNAKDVPDDLGGMVERVAGLCKEVNGPLLAAQIEQESEWDPQKVSPVGAEGISQFKPETWAKYGVDANENGIKSPWEVEDAIVSQGLYMCILANKLQITPELEHDVPVDITTETLWAYNAGIEATEAAKGRPPTAEADNYARRILNELVPKYRP